MVKVKTIFVTALVCLLPIILGVALWDRLPDSIAIHFELNGNADGFAQKGFVFFVLPALMAVVQVFLCIANNLKNQNKISPVTVWIIPILTVVLYTMTMLIALGYGVDTRRVCMVIVGIVMMVIGASVRKLDWVKNRDCHKETALKINRLSGNLMIFSGVAFVASIFFPPIASVICLGILAICGVIVSAYSAKVSKGM